MSQICLWCYCVTRGFGFNSSGTTCGFANAVVKERDLHRRKKPKKGENEKNKLRDFVVWKIED